MILRMWRIKDIDKNSSYGRLYLDTLKQGIKDFKTIIPFFRRSYEEIHRDLVMVRKAYNAQKGIRESDLSLNSHIATDIAKVLV